MWHTQAMGRAMGSMDTPPARRRPPRHTSHCHTAGASSAPPNRSHQHCAPPLRLTSRRHPCGTCWPGRPWRRGRTTASHPSPVDEVPSVRAGGAGVKAAATAAAAAAAAGQQQGSSSSRAQGQLQAGGRCRHPAACNSQRQLHPSPCPHLVLPVLLMLQRGLVGVEVPWRAGHELWAGSRGAKEARACRCWSCRRSCSNA